MPLTDPPQSDKLPFFPKRKRFLLPVLILLVIAFVGLPIGAWVGIAKIKNSASFAATHAELKAHPAVKHHVGLPFESGWWVIGKHDDHQGTYDLTFGITGPHGQATVKSRCTQDRADGPWRVTYLQLGVGGRDGQVLTLIGDPDAPPGGLE